MYSGLYSVQYLLVHTRVAQSVAAGRSGYMCQSSLYMQWGTTQWKFYVNCILVTLHARVWNFCDIENISGLIDKVISELQLWVNWVNLDPNNEEKRWSIITWSWITVWESRLHYYTYIDSYNGLTPLLWQVFSSFVESRILHFFLIIPRQTKMTSARVLLNIEAMSIKVAINVLMFYYLLKAKILSGIPWTWV